MEVTGVRMGTCGPNVNDKFDGQTILTLFNYVTRKPIDQLSQVENSRKEFRNSRPCLPSIFK